MVYLGSKKRLCKDILPIILQEREIDQYYVEPFCGGCNVICHVTGNRVASDINPYLIAMFQGLTKNRKVYLQIDETLYDAAFNSFKSSDGTFCDFDLGWIGFMASYRGKFFSGFSGKGKNGQKYVNEFIRNILGQVELLKGIEFHCCDYANLKLPENSLIYCDIPYKGTTGYKNAGQPFDYEKFYRWCFQKKSEGHRVFISEYSMPSEFELVFEKPTVNIINNSNKTVYERLYKA